MNPAGPSSSREERSGAAGAGSRGGSEKAAAGPEQATEAPRADRETVKGRLLGGFYHTGEHARRLARRILGSGDLER